MNPSRIRVSQTMQSQDSQAQHNTFGEHGQAFTHTGVSASTLHSARIRHVFTPRATNARRAGSAGPWAPILQRHLYSCGANIRSLKVICEHNLSALSFYGEQRASAPKLFLHRDTSSVASHFSHCGTLYRLVQPPTLHRCNLGAHERERERGGNCTEDFLFSAGSTARSASLLDVLH